MRILIIDDEESMRHMLSVILKKEGYDTVSAHDAQAGLTLLEKDEFDFILSDIRMPGMDGTGLLKAIADKGVASPVIIMSAYGSMDSAMECMKLGAYDYISKPFKADEIVLVLRKAEERERLRRENRRLKEEAAREYDVSGIRTSDPVMEGVLGLVLKIADYSTSVLITGESGTGKELVARAIHYGGRRSGGPFVVVNCGALPGPLLESELFGHVKGAFTDAHRSKAGLFQEAEGGTIFLDEVGELPMELQVKLLRVLQEGEVRRVGDNRPVKVDARVVAATLRDLKHEISRGAFREDLFYRLNVIEVKLPPLRERQGDVPLLAEWFVEKYARKFIKPPKAISAGAMEALKRYSWPGNIRELENVIERAMILEETGTIRESSLPLLAGPEAPRSAGPSDLSIKKAQESMERELIRKALDQTGNNKTKAAMLLEISHRALLYKIKSYGL
ncbi:MAG: sigma-54-dependent Fis family transcriptional regulator [Deltaproteobacteria bacterium]|nr:sigma-54-dependent Fis family transcriptional regulator [Deltaproteobacteria bacterium]MBZ0221230.1 sigma-54 dependent transcriptional regulator [Deltaproteobacteria bacterium]